MSPGDLSFSAPAFGRQTLYNSYMERKFREKKEYKEFIKRLQRVLDPGSQYSMKSTLERQLEEDFVQLHVQNDQYQPGYSLNPDNSSKLLMVNLLENHPLFRNKRENQTKALLAMLSRLYNRGQPMTELTFWQFKEMVETAHGVADKKLIMSYVLAYLPFDEYGELSKKEMDRVLSVAVAG